MRTSPLDGMRPHLAHCVAVALSEAGPGVQRAQCCPIPPSIDFRRGTVIGLYSLGTQVASTAPLPPYLRRERVHVQLQAKRHGVVQLQDIHQGL